MKKKVLTAAVAALVAVPFAASADTTLFGQLHTSIDVLSTDSGANDSAIAVSSNTSRIGVKGAHDFGNGLKGVYHAEWGISGSGDENNLNSRNTFVGLAGGFGTVLLGKHDTPLKIVGRKADLFWSTQLGQNRSLTHPMDNGVPGQGWDLRAPNVIAYVSPKLGPVTIIAAYVTDHTLAGGSAPIKENNDNDAVSALAMGQIGPVFAAVGYEQHNAAGAADSPTALRVTLTGNVGPVKLVGFYQQAKDQGFIAGNDRDVYGVGASFKAGSNTFKGQVYQADNNDNLGADNGATLIAVGIDHALAKNTQVYAQYAQMDNEANANFALGGAGHGTNTKSGANGEVISGVSLGIRLKF